MTEDEIRAGREAIVAEHGPWGSANIALPYGLFTIDNQPRGDNHRTLKFLQIVSDMLDRPLHSLRVVDLACGEGLYAIEFARHGAKVLGIEGRAANFAKADFARAALELDNLRFVQDDVRAFSAERYGQFDVVLCSGILYHLDQPACFHFLKAIRAVSTALCIIDTRIAMQPEIAVAFEGRTYWGSIYREHADTDSPETRLANLGASLDNPTSFWFTRLSLANLLTDLGFTSVFDCLAPVPLNTRADRVTLVARPGRGQRPFNAVAARLDGLRWPDGEPE